MKIQGPQFQRDYVIAWKFLGGGGIIKDPLGTENPGGWGGCKSKSLPWGGGGFFFLTTEVFTCSKLINAFKR